MPSLIRTLASFLGFNMPTYRSTASAGGNRLSNSASEANDSVGQVATDGGPFDSDDCYAFGTTAGNIIFNFPRRAGRLRPLIPIVALTGLVSTVDASRAEARNLPSDDSSKWTIRELDDDESCPLWTEWDALEVRTDDAARTISIGKMTFAIQEEQGQADIRTLFQLCNTGIPMRKTFSGRWERQEAPRNWYKSMSKSKRIFEEWVVSGLQREVLNQRTEFAIAITRCGQGEVELCASISSHLPELSPWLRKPWIAADNARMVDEGWATEGRDRLARAVSSAPRAGRGPRAANGFYFLAELEEARLQATTSLRKKHREAVDACVTAYAKTASSLSSSAAEEVLRTCERAQKDNVTFVAKLAKLNNTTPEIQSELAADRVKLADAEKMLPRFRARQEFLKVYGDCVRTENADTCKQAATSNAPKTADELSKVRALAEAEARREAERTRQAQESAQRASQTDARSKAIVKDAEQCARTQIYNRLRAPSTSSMSLELMDRDGFCYAYAVTVDAQNGFGAYIRNNYCVFVKITDPWSDDPSHFVGDQIDESFAAMFGGTTRSVCSNDISPICSH